MRRLRWYRRLPCKQLLPDGRKAGAVVQTGPYIETYGIVPLRRIPSPQRAPRGEHRPHRALDLVQVPVTSESPRWSWNDLDARKLITRRTRCARLSDPACDTFPAASSIPASEPVPDRADHHVCTRENRRFRLRSKGQSQRFEIFRAAHRPAAHAACVLPSGRYADAAERLQQNCEPAFRKLAISDFCVCQRQQTGLKRSKREYFGVGK